MWMKPSPSIGEDDPAVGRSRAADLRDDAALRHGARERRDRSRDARARSRRRSVHREHARGVSDFVHRQRRPVRAGRASEERRDADRRRVRRAAADLAADARRARCITSCPATPRRSRARKRASPSRRRRSARASARRSCRCAPSRYAKMLGERIARHNARVWLVNTGWTGGAVRHRQADEDRATRAR